jgi:hypothetical protein
LKFGFGNKGNCNELEAHAKIVIYKTEWDLQYSKHVSHRKFWDWRLNTKAVERTEGVLMIELLVGILVS